MGWSSKQNPTGYSMPAISPIPRVPDTPAQSDARAQVAFLANAGIRGGSTILPSISAATSKQRSVPTPSPQTPLGW